MIGIILCIPRRPIDISNEYLIIFQLDVCTIENLQLSRA